MLIKLVYLYEVLTKTWKEIGYLLENREENENIWVYKLVTYYPKIFEIYFT